jgi:hypothetical protein
MTLPGWRMIVITILVQLLGLFFAVYGILMPACGWANAGIAIGITAAFLIGFDILKVLLFRLFRSDLFCISYVRRFSDNPTKNQQHRHHTTAVI